MPADTFKTASSGHLMQVASIAAMASAEILLIFDMITSCSIFPFYPRLIYQLYGPQLHNKKTTVHGNERIHHTGDMVESR